MASPEAAHRAQIESFLVGWGMPSRHAARAADIMAWADLHGIDSHGIAMIPVYFDRHRAGRINMAAEPRFSRETAISALVDGDGGLGYEPSRRAMEAAIARAQGIGVGIVSVRNSGHFGACGFYAKMAADAGLIGMVASSASMRQVAPTGGRQARLGTDPWAFAAPGRDGEPFILDMATTTVASGRLANKAREHLPVPTGWVVTQEGLPSTDPLEAAQKGGFLTPLGGSAEGASHKGYGLAAMVNILACCLSGATLVTDPMHTRKPHGIDIGHFLLALNPTLFREAGAFEADVAGFCEALRATLPIDPANPVLVAGDPERATASGRGRDGIPIAPNLRDKLRAIAGKSRVPWLLD